MTGFTQMLFGAITTQFAGHVVAGATSVLPALVCHVGDRDCMPRDYIVLLPPKKWACTDRALVTQST